MGIPDAKQVGKPCVGGGDGSRCLCRHPISEAKPDYHWQDERGWFPRWRNPLKSMPDSRDWWYRIDEVAQQTGYSPYHLRRLMRKGTLRARKTPGGRSWFVQARDLEAFMRGERPAAA